MNKNINLNEVLSKFSIDSKIENYGNGHINDTYLTNTPRFILQRINTNIFTNPEQLMSNISKVTAFLKEKIKKAGGDPNRETLTVIKTCDGKDFYLYDEDNAFRVYNFITDTKTIEEGASLTDIYFAGKGFGKFQNMLDDFPVDTLYETIVDFHNTPKRVDALKLAISEDRAGRASKVQREIEFALENAEFAGVAVDALAKGEIPLRVTHNDTKINNILFDNQSNEAVCVIDLDTVMPGSSLYDFGDALRMGASTAAEDETQLDKVQFNEECFRSFARGFFEEMRSSLTPREIELLPFSAKLLTYECGIRFLTDYLNGDTYFKIHRENHNIDRARNQFKLVSNIANKEDALNQIIKELQ